MRKWLAILLVLMGLFLAGCSADEEVSSLSEYEMVYQDMDFNPYPAVI